MTGFYRAVKRFEEKRKRKEGFTLVELLIVVAIIGILAAIAIPQFGKYRRDAAKNACLADLRNAITACAAALAADPTKDKCTQGTDYPSQTTNAVITELKVETDGTITASASCKGAASGISVSCNSTGGSLQCS